MRYFLAVFLAISSGCGAVPPIDAVEPESRKPFLFEVVGPLAPACSRFREAPAYTAGTPCARARVAATTIHEMPGGDHGAALRELDELCERGLVEACDVGRDLMGICAARVLGDEGKPWWKACAILQSAERAPPPGTASGRLVRGRPPPALLGCFVVEAVRTCEDRTLGNLRPNETGTCEINFTDCSDDRPGVFELEYGAEPVPKAACEHAPHPAAVVGAKHCFDTDRWSSTLPDGRSFDERVTWELSLPFDALAASTKTAYAAPAMTLEGIGARPVLRIARSRAWLRRLSPGASAVTPRP